jgi:hypothetical protein
MSFIDLLGYAASAAVLATFCMSTMIPLRVLALGSNVLFMAYGYADHLYPVLMLHAILFPVNALRLLQFQRLVRDIRRAHHEDLSIRSLLPYMKQSKHNAGEILFHKGDKADSMYYLMDGELEITDFNKSLTPGAVVGEVGVFSRSQLRTATVKCRTECNLFELTERKVKELYFQDRSFGFALLQLIIARLIENSEWTMQPAIAVASAKGAGQSA